jgi:hypothetical protein
MRSPQNATTAMIPIGSQKLTGRPKTPADIKNTKKMPIAPPLGVGIQCELRPFGQSTGHIKPSQSHVFTLSELET